MCHNYGPQGQGLEDWCPRNIVCSWGQLQQKQKLFHYRHPLLLYINANLKTQTDTYQFKTTYFIFQRWRDIEPFSFRYSFVWVGTVTDKASPKNKPEKTNSTYKTNKHKPDNVCALGIIREKVFLVFHNRYWCLDYVSVNIYCNRRPDF